MVFASGCDLPFCDKAFDIVFSNSVIEHVGDPSEQQRLAEEIRRAARLFPDAAVIASGGWDGPSR